MSAPQTSESTELRALIIGGGVAGTTCAASLAANHPQFSITLIDPAPAIRIATTISRITPTAHDINISTETPETWCNKYGITFFRGIVRRLLPNEIHLDDGRVHKFDVCCIATGARPVLPPGLHDIRFRNAIYMLRDTDSVERLKQRLKGVKRVMVVGAGGIAMEVVYELVDCNVFWVVKGHIGGSFFDARLGALMAGVGDSGVCDKADMKDHTDREVFGMSEKVMAGSGVGPDWLGKRDGPFLLDKNGNVIEKEEHGRLRGGGGRGKYIQVVNAEVLKLTADGKRTHGVVADLSDGTRIECDMIIVGAGVTPNTAWLSSSGIDIHPADGGIITKSGNMETSIPNVYAAGDCTHVTEGGINWSQMRVWGQAFVAGRAAAAGMGRLAGGEGYTGLEFDVFAHATKFFGRKVVLLGRFDCDGGKVYERVDEKEILRVCVVDGRVRGALLVGDIDCAEVFENLIVSGLDIGFLGEQIVEKELELEEFFD